MSREPVNLLFDVDELENWRDLWQGMPEFIQEDLAPWKSLVVHFENKADMEAFAAAIGQKIRKTTRSIWFPPAEIGRYVNKRYTNES
jgi:hypothetical protein